MKCSSCGNELVGNEGFCGSCGSPVVKEAAETSTNPSIETVSDSPVNPPVIAPPQPTYAAPPVNTYNPNAAPPQPYQNMAQPAVNNYGTPQQYYGGYPPQQQYKKKKKGKGCLIGIISFLVVIALIVVGINMLLPGLFGPKGLGVKTTEAAYNSFMQKINYFKDDAPDGKSREDYTYTFGPPNRVSTALTSEEITSFMNYNRPDYFAVKNVQVRINEDGTMEASGTISVDYILSEIFGGEYSADEIDEYIPLAGLIPDDINIYMKASGEITGNQAVGVDVQGASVMGISVLNYVDPADLNAVITEAINSVMSSFTSSTGTTFNSVRMENGQLVFDGDVPSYLEREEK